MNGAQYASDTSAQQLPQGASAAAAPSNGNSPLLNKKRKKDGLKPIITTESPGYVHRPHLKCSSFCRRGSIKCLGFLPHF
ncbi:hypothetical protein L209DRAFT_758368 [Thermothelomyces heterothallicus CBS 203.75]